MLAAVSYDLAGAFEPLDATGTADIYDLGLIYPLIRQRGHIAAEHAQHLSAIQSMEGQTPDGAQGLRGPSGVWA